MMIIKVFLSFVLALQVAVSAAGAREYFVGPEGCDETYDGLSREASFATIQQGVDALEPGDTLIILPGDYFGSVRRAGLGAEGLTTTIRADIPGTVVLRGDVPVDGFRPADGYRFVYVADFEVDAEVQAVNELNTLQVLDQQPNVALVAFTPGSFHHDRAAGRLYLSPPDLRPASGHRYSVSVNETHGLHLSGARRVEIEGLAVTGFHTATMRSGREGAHGGVYGIFLSDSADCVVRDTRAWLNAQGIGISSGQQASEAIRGGNVIERCTAWANASPHGWGDMGGLTIFHGRGDTIRDSLSFRNAGYGANIYNSARGLDESDVNRNRLIRNITWGNGLADLKIKAEPWHVTERCVGHFGTNSLNPIHCLFGRPYPAAGPDSIQLESEENLDLNAEFADPENHDYRLQATSRFRGAGPDGSDRGPYPYEPNIFYVSPDGEDDADGLSLKTAWNSFPFAMTQLRPGDTLYLEPGNYVAGAPVTLNGTSDRPIIVRSRGRDQAVIDGRFALEASAQVTFERLAFTGGVRLSDGQGIKFENCWIAGDESAIEAQSVRDFRVTQCLLSGFGKSGLWLTDCAEVFLQGSRFENRGGAGVRSDTLDAVFYSDYNSYQTAETAWLVNGRELALAELPPARESYGSAREQIPDAADDDVPWHDPVAPAATGPFGRPAGPYSYETPGELLRLHGPFLHSVTDTTANFEWWISDLARFEFAWGTDPEALANTVRRDSNLFGSFSMTELEPDTAYFLRLKASQPFERESGAEAVAHNADSVMIAFRTAPTAEAPQIFHVAPDGDDRHDGLSRQHAWRTVQHAAGQVRPGDTVLIGGGTYHESVRLRTTGEAGRPITFRAAPGEKVVFDGLERNLCFAFLAQDKSHLRFDGFYFTGYRHGSEHMPWRINRRGGHSNGYIVLSESRDVQVTRCFADGRGPGYAPGLLRANNSPDLVVENNVMLRNMGRLSIRHLSPRARVRHNVFLVNLIRHFAYHPRGSRHVMDPPDRPLIEKNIFTDNLLSKRNVSLAISERYVILRDNCFYLRVPPAQRVWNGEESFADMLAGRKPGDHTLVGDPHFKATLDRERIDAEGNPVFLGDYLLRQQDLDFPDLFATNPELTEHSIGLQPEAFEDFHFHMNLKDNDQ